MSAESSNSRDDIFHLHFKTKAALYEAYMPFIDNGGIFIPTKHAHKLGDDVFAIIQLLDEAEKHSIAGKVAWITPTGAQAGRKTGVGIQFISKNAEEVRQKIETLLAGALNSGRQTDTI